MEIEAADTDVSAPTEVMTNRSSDFRRQLWLKTSRPSPAAGGGRRSSQCRRGKRERPAGGRTAEGAVARLPAAWLR